MRNPENCNEMRRREFLKTASLSGAALCGIGLCSSARAYEEKAQTASLHAKLTVRPYQLLCTICSLGGGDYGPAEKRSRKILDTVRQNPDIPITLKCNMREVFAFQTSGPEDDTPGGVEFNKKRDMDILYRLNVPPGTTLSARILFNRLLDRITTVSGICDCANVASDDWKGCPKAKSGRYEEARKKGVKAIIPARSEAEMAKDKKASLEAMYKAKTTGISVKPHILLCAVCQYGGGTRPPYPPDNLPELIQLILKEPDTLITMGEGAPWMMCGPCPNRSPKLNACVNVKGSGGVTNQLRDLRMLQILGLAFGSTIKAKELYKRIFERIPNTQPVCAFDSSPPSVWWDGCGESNCKKGNANYEKGRKELLEKLG